MKRNKFSSVAVARSAWPGSFFTFLLWLCFGDILFERAIYKTEWPNGPFDWTVKQTAGAIFKAYLSRSSRVFEVKEMVITEDNNCQLLYNEYVWQAECGETEVIDVCHRIRFVAFAERLWMVPVSILGAATDALKYLKWTSSSGKCIIDWCDCSPLEDDSCRCRRSLITLSFKQNERLNFCRT